MLRKTVGPTLRHLLKIYGWLEYTMIHIPRICNVHITEHWHLHQLLQPPLLLCLCHLSSHEKPKAGVFSMSFPASCSKQCWSKRIFFRQPRGPSPFYCAPGMKYVSRPSHASNNKDMCFIDISYIYIIIYLKTNIQEHLNTPKDWKLKTITYIHNSCFKLKVQRAKIVFGMFSVPQTKVLYWKRADFHRRTFPGPLMK